MDQMDSIGALGNTLLIPLAVDNYCLHIQDESSNSLILINSLFVSCLYSAY